MKSSALIMAFCATVSLYSVAQNLQNSQTIPLEKEQKYGSANDTSLPDWVRAMYADDPNLPEVEHMYNEYYKIFPFVKNSHTQYYKRWMKTYRRYVNEEGKIRPPEKAAFDADWANLAVLRLEQQQQVQDRGVSGWGVSNWKGIGPSDFDKDAAGRSHAPGSSHVYTLEKAPSNPDILYCGTATAGVWKTTDRGLNWTLLTKSLPINYCNAIEIHPTDPNIVFFGANGRVYKSIDGGANWTVIGDANFNTLSHSTHEIVYKPGDVNVLFVGSDKGFYRSIDGGANFTRLIIPRTVDGYFSEVEFKPGQPNTMYVVQSGVNDRYTELYKSTDGGNTFTLLSGWPVLATANSATYQYINRPSAGTNYAAFANDNLGDATTPDFTLEMRMRFPPTTIYDKAILGNKNWSSGSNKGWVLAARYTGELTFNMGTGGSRVDLHTSGIWDDVWHHITVVYRASGLKELYKDGVLMTSTSTNIGTNVVTGLSMILGYDANLAYGGHEMNIDEIRIFNTALSAATISAWKDLEVNNTHPNFANLLHYHKCNEPSGTSLVDEMGTNNGTITGTINRKSEQVFSSTTSLAGTDHQRRAEISVTAAMPDRIYALMGGSANGGSGLYGVYVSDDSGTSWTHKCCGPGPGGAAAAGTNPNLLGYSETGSEDGGQYYYDLAMEADPGNGNKVHIGGINHWYSLDGGNTFTLTAKWSWPDDPEYVHADIHGIHIYGNEVWINNDGGIFMSVDSGKINYNKRQFGIQGTDFWGFGMGHKDAEVMLGGTYHNSHLMKNNNVYINGWTSYTGSADGTRGFVNPGKPKTVYNDSGKDVLPNNRTTAPNRTTFSKLPNTGGTPSKITWDPRCYNCLYTGNGADLWYSDDDGNNFTLVRNFGTMNVADIEVSWANPNTLYVCTVGGFYDPKEIWKSTDRGQTWTNITPSSATLGFASDMSFDIALGDNDNDLWLACFHPYNWNSSNNNKVFYSSNGGTSWTNWSTAVTNGQGINNIQYQRGANGVYLGTNKTVLYRNKNMSEWVIFDTGLPVSTASLKVLPWYKEGKIRNAGNRSVWESPMFELGTPQAQPMADRLNSFCVRDTVYFADYSAHYKTGASWQWNISPAPTYINSTTIEDPKVVFGSVGTYTVSLTVSDSMGVNTKAFLGDFSVTSGCNADTLVGNALQITANGQYAATSKNTHLNTNTVTLMAWVKPTVTHTGVTGVLFFRGGTTVTGIHLENNNRIAYHWNDGFWSYNSGLFLPTNEWSHIAMVVEPTKTTLYLNGQPKVSSGTHAIEAFDAPLNIGRDPSSSSRTFKGLIDEVCVYKRALSQNEIREQMHFVKKPQSEPDLVSYYQINESSGTDVPDRAGIYHAKITGASRILSSAPFGTGVVSRKSVSAGGLTTFGNTGVGITFSNISHPNGELTVSRLFRQPDVLPSTNACSHDYWIINNYGANSTFAALTDIRFDGIGSTLNNDVISLYKRPTSYDGATWGAPVSTFTTTSASNNANITFDGSSITSFSQFSISAQNSPLPVEWLSFYLKQIDSPAAVELFWATASERNSAYFMIERSRNGQDFEPIGQLTAAGYSDQIKQYSSIDKQPLAGVSYYRIKQVDKNGDFTYSTIQSVAFRPLHQRFEILPNPVPQGSLLQIVSELDGYIATAHDANGREIFRQELTAGNNSIQMGQLAAGTYFIRISNGIDTCLKKVILE